MFTSPPLRDLGWTTALEVTFDDTVEALRAAWDASDSSDVAAEWLPGRVGRVDRGESDVFTADGPRRVYSDSQRSQDSMAPATGDWVVVRDDDQQGAVIAQILDRSTAIVRRDPSEQVVEQVLVANADIVGVVQGLDQEVNIARIERFLVLAWDSGATPLIVLTKSDALTPHEVDAAVEQVAAITDTEVLATSIIDGHGLDALREAVAESTLVLIGPSGAGKSSLVNALVGDEVQATAEVREGDAKGRHTTVSRDLIPLPGGGVLIDTPGVRAVGVWAADVALDRVFADIADLAEQCRFRDCTHRSEPGCAIQAAIAEGALSAARLERYHALWDEITTQAEHAEQRHWRRRKRRR